MPPRNAKAFRAGMRVRAAVRDLLASRTQLEPQLTAPQINALLPPQLRRCTSVIRWHRRCLQTEYLIQSITDRPPPC
jgi:hypothetical protein